jgi:DNA-directed RNA polymerase subunit RPC12/RpoP
MGEKAKMNESGLCEDGSVCGLDEEAEYECEECETQYCESCAEFLDFECDCNKPRIVKIKTPNYKISKSYKKNDKTKT